MWARFLRLSPSANEGRVLQKTQTLNREKHSPSKFVSKVASVSRNDCLDGSVNAGLAFIAGMFQLLALCTKALSRIWIEGCV